MKAATLKDGFGITVTLTGHDFSLLLDPSSITPPGIDGGDAIDTTTHSNSAVRTKHPRSLKEITDAAMTVVYDPDAWDDIVSAVNDNVAITFAFPGAAFGSVVVYGYLKSFIPNEYVEGEQATAECVLVITNENGSGVETAPVHTTAP
jgi:hypothetical protein